MEEIEKIIEIKESVEREYKKYRNHMVKRGADIVFDNVVDIYIVQSLYDYITDLPENDITRTSQQLIKLTCYKTNACEEDTIISRFLDEYSDFEYVSVNTYEDIESFIAKVYDCSIDE